MRAQRASSNPEFRKGAGNRCVGLTTVLRAWLKSSSSRSNGAEKAPLLLPREMTQASCGWQLAPCSLGLRGAVVEHDAKRVERKIVGLDHRVVFG